MTSQHNHPTPMPDDPNLTAYALGELDPASELYQQVHAQLQRDPQARAFVNEARALAEQLRSSFRAAESSATLTDPQQQELATMINQPNQPNEQSATAPKILRMPRKLLLAAGLALAATAVITTITLLPPSNQNTKQTQTNIAPVTGHANVSKALTQEVTANYDNTSLREVFAALHQQTGVAIDANWSALAVRGVDANTKVTLMADKPVPASAVLSEALRLAWVQSPHPDAAQWAMNDAGITIAPKSTLVQARLDATAKLLANRQFSQAPVDGKLLKTGKAEVWDTNLWNDILTKRAEAGDRILAEANASLTAAESAASKDDLATATDHGQYAYQLLANYASILKADQFEAPMSRIEKLQQQVELAQQRQHASLVQQAIADLGKQLESTADDKTRTQLQEAIAKAELAEKALKDKDINTALRSYDEAASLAPEVEGLASLRTQTRDRLSAGQYYADYSEFGISNKVDALAVTNGSFGAKPSAAYEMKAKSAPALLFEQSGVTRTTGMPAANQPRFETLSRLGSELKPSDSLRYDALGQSTVSQGGSREDLRRASKPMPGSPVPHPTVQAERFERELAEQDETQGGAFFSADPGYSQPQIDLSRKAQYDAALKELGDKNAPDEQALEERKKYQQALITERERVAPFEPLERDRIEAMKQLQELERRFIDESMPSLTVDPQMSRDSYAMVNDNPFYNPADHDDNGQNRAISTFSVDVDTAAYTLVRRQLMQQRQLPVPGAIRIEEMINYFDYNYSSPIVDGRALKDGIVTQASLEAFEKQNKDFAPFATHVQLTDCPWQAGNKLVRIGIKGMEVAQEDRPAAHLTFLLDVSGSMNNANKLPLVKDALKLLLTKLNDKDRVSIVVYAGASGLVLENVSASDRATIEAAMDNLKAGGSTAGAAGIQLAYNTAQKHYIDGGVNRVILCTDGDFNVGISDTDDLVALIKDKANPAADADGKKRGVYLSAMGFGMGNLNDAMMEPLTNAGNGTYAYIDTLAEAQKVMYDQAGATLVTIAKDVKVQVHFDPLQVMAYRLIGYENRVLANEDFDNDKVDAGDIGAGHSVTALYEIVPFDNDGLFNNPDAIREVRLQIDQLDQAITLNYSLMQTCALNEDQAMKLAASTRLLEQERTLCDSAVERLEAGQAKQEAPAVELDSFDDGALMSIRLRYKPVDAPAEDGTSRKIETRVFADQTVAFDKADESTRFAAAVAGFGMVMRGSPHKANADLNWVLDTAKTATTHDPDQYRAQFIELVGEAMSLMPVDVPVEDAGAPK